MKRPSTVKKLLLWTILFLVLSVQFRQMFFQFFSADDWFHLRISTTSLDIHTFAQFFSFVPNQVSSSFYRPLPTQVFFSLLFATFGFQTFGWYCVVFITFCISLLSIYALIKTMSSATIASISTLIYAFSHTHSTRLYFLSAFQEILLVCTATGSLYFFLKKKMRYSQTASIIFYFAALASKETAVTIPGLLIVLVLLEGLTQRHFTIKDTVYQTIRRVWPHIIITVAYLYMRFAVFGFSAVEHHSYRFSLHLTDLLKTLSWYTIWALGLPESLINYQNNFSIIPRWYTDYPIYGTAVLISASLAILLLLIISIRAIQPVFYFRGKFVPKTVDIQLVLISLAFFILPLVPVLVFPEHTFALELGLPMIGFSLLIAQIVQSQKYLGVLALLSVVSLNILSTELTQKSHYSILRAQTAHTLFSLFRTNYTELPEHTVVLFTNDRTDLPSNWGVSKQISEALQGDEFFFVLYPNKSVLAEYEDLPHTVSGKKPDIILGSSQFLY